jgi:hypothetical protein
MGELASESQGSKELGKTLAWEEDLETPQNCWIYPGWSGVLGVGMKTKLYLLNKKSSFKMVELIRGTLY